MKIHTKIVLLVALLVSFASCSKSFLEYDPNDSVPAGEGYNSVTALNVALTGAYADLAGYRFLGRDVTALGDMAADGLGANLSENSGHFGSIYQYNFNDADPELSDMWTYGYKVINNVTLIIEAAPKLVAENKVFDYEVAQLNGIVAQAYAIRATAAFYLTNIFGKPYPDATAGMGIVKVTTKIEPNQKVARSSVNDCYAWIESDLKAARDIFAAGNASVSKSAFYLNSVGVNAMSARVLFYMGKYAEAKVLADAIIATSGKSIVDADRYVEMWGSISVSSEDIFTLAKNAADNLSANSINTLYQNYGAAATVGLVGLYSDTDVRAGLYAATSVANVFYAMKYPGIPGSEATNNIPVMRLPEVIYISAEATARTASVSDAINIAAKVALERDPALDLTAIPTDKDGFISWLAEERFKEMAQEGNRFYDARRLGLLLTRSAGNTARYTNFDIKSFVYPIPLAEVNSGWGVLQTPDWVANMPAINK